MNSIAMLLQNDAWHGVGHATPKFGESWGPVEWVGLGATVLLGVGLVALIAIAIARNSRYRAVGVVSEGELESVRNKIADVEKRTTGEVMVVLLERSDRHPAAHWLAALSLLFVGSVLLWTWLPWGDPVLLLSVQAGLAVCGYALTRALPDLHNRFISVARAREMAEEQAIQEFHQLELRETKGRTGVLLMVSLLEHRVVVLGDHGIDSKVAEGTWDRVQQSILAHVRTGHLGQGLLDGVDVAGDILAEHFPGGVDSEDLPNIVIVRRE